MLEKIEDHCHHLQRLHHPLQYDNHHVEEDDGDDHHVKEDDDHDHHVEEFDHHVEEDEGDV